MTPDLLVSLFFGAGYQIFLLTNLISYFDLPTVIFKIRLLDSKSDRHRLCFLLKCFTRRRLILLLIFFWQVNSEQRSIILVLYFSVAPSYSHKLLIILNLAALVGWDVFFNFFHEFKVGFLGFSNRISDLFSFNWTHFSKFVESFLSNRDHIFKNVP